MTVIKSTLDNEPMVEGGTCKRCGRKTTILSNDYCHRCDDVLFGRKEETPRYNPIPNPYRPYSPYKNDPIPFPHPKRRQIWC